MVAAGLAVAVAAAALILLGGTDSDGGDGARVVQPSAPGEGVREVSPEELDLLAEEEPTEADIEFMHGMIHHHAQAIQMAGLLDERTDNEEVALLAGRIEVSQQSEIELMNEWLEAHGVEPHASHEHGGGPAELMPGMLTPRQMERLADARDGEFDRLFCRLMIQHHEGALVMVGDLRDAGGGLVPEVYRLSSDIEADQEIEIRRMREMLSGRFGEGV